MTAVQSEPQLFVKSFFADSVEETLDRARIELGPDALLLNERESPPESRHLGAFEVVFGVRPVAPRPSLNPSGEKIANLKQTLQGILGLMDGERAPEVRPQPAPQSRASIAQRLSGEGVDPSLAAEIEQAVERRLRTRSIVQIGRPGRGHNWSADDLMKETVAEVESRFEVAPEIGRRCMLIGPPGAGKTTTLVKLAVVRGLSLGRPVSLVSMDDTRVGGADQLQAYAGILNVPFAVAGTPEKLSQVINATSAETLLLIDTPGHTALTIEDAGHQLADYLRRRQDIDTHLVLTASMREADLRRTVDRFLEFAPAKLLFTRLDETEATGSMLSEAARTRKPISFLCAGQTVPEDIASATKARICRPLARKLPLVLEAVA